MRPGRLRFAELDGALEALLLLLQTNLESYKRGRYSGLHPEGVYSTPNAPGTQKLSKQAPRAGVERTYCREPHLGRSRTADKKVYTREVREAVLRVSRLAMQSYKIGQVGVDSVDTAEDPQLLEHIFSALNRIRQGKRKQAQSEQRWRETSGINVFQFFTHELNMARRRSRSRLELTPEPQSGHVISSHPSDTIASAQEDSVHTQFTRVTSITDVRNAAGPTQGPEVYSTSTHASLSTPGAQPMLQEWVTFDQARNGTGEL